MHFYAFTVRTFHGIYLKQVSTAPLDLYQAGMGYPVNPHRKSRAA